MGWTFYVIECDAGLSATLITMGFGTWIEWVSLVLCPEWFGAPAGRKRRFTIGWDQTRVQMRQPPSVQLLLSLFGRRLCMDAMGLFVATEEDLLLQVRKMA